MAIADQATWTKPLSLKEEFGNSKAGRDPKHTLSSFKLFFLFVHGSFAQPKVEGTSLTCKTGKGRSCSG